VQKSLVINHSPEELYRFWHNFENCRALCITSNLSNQQATAVSLGGKRPCWDNG